MAQTKTIDITPARIKLPVIEVSQFDIGRPIIIHMKDGDEWYDLTGYTVKLQGTKPSGFGYSVTGVVSGHDVTFTTTYDMTSEAGFILSEVSIIDGESPIGSQNAMLHVEQSPHLPTVVDGSPETVLPEMRELVNRAEAAAEILLDCSAIATTLPTGASATASYSPETGVFSFGLPRGAKGETGETGAAGNGIASIAKTGTSGLVDTYTITYTNGTTTTFTVTNGQNGTGSVADVTQNGVSVLDGSTAKVTVPTYDAVTDNEPYLFRTSGGGIDIGNREDDTLVGGSVAWNQLVQNGDFADTSNWRTSGSATLSISNSEAVLTWTGNANASIAQTLSPTIIPNHKFIALATMKGVSARQTFMQIGNTYKTFTVTSSYAPYGVICTPTSLASGSSFFAGYITGNSGDTLNIKNVCIFDLTQMFGSTIADAIYAMEQSTAGSGVAFFKSLFPNSFYPYSSGELMSVSGVSSHDMTGFNQLPITATSTTSAGVTFTVNSDGTITTSGTATSATYFYTTANVENYLHAGYQYYISGCPSGGGSSKYGIEVLYGRDPALWARDIGNGATFTMTNSTNLRAEIFVASGTNMNGLTFKPCISISGSRNGEYEPYELHSYALDSTLTLRGIPKLSNGKLYYDGDTYASDGTVTRKYGIVDLGSLTWTYNGSGDNMYFRTESITDGRANVASGATPVFYMCSKYLAVAPSVTADLADKQICRTVNGSSVYFVKDSAYTDAATFKTAMTGVYLVYELATPTTETAEPYTNPQVVDESGTEEYVSTSIVPVGHQTAYPDLFSGDYNDLVNKPTIPTETSQLTNDSDFVIDASYVHTDNNFTTTLKDKLDGIASGAEVNVQADWNEQSSASDAYIANKPTIPTVPAWAQAPSKPTYTASEVGAATADHVHGYITNGGDITASVTIANGDRLVINDESASKVLNSSITFGTATNTYLRNNGTWGAPKTSTTASLTVAGWSSSTQTVTVTGVTTTNDVIVSPAPASYDAYVSAGIRCTAQASNSLTFTCTATPSEAITVNVLIIL